MNCPSCSLGTIIGPRFFRYCDGCRMDIPEYLIDLLIENMELKQSVKTITVDRDTNRDKASRLEFPDTTGR